VAARAHAGDARRQGVFVLAPDWVCEVLSPSTASLDRGDKLKAYAAFDVKHVWFVDPEARTLEILSDHRELVSCESHDLERDEKGYRVFDVFSGEATVRAVPFDAIGLELGLLWQR
jgi:Uma2 family endonuclease